MKHRLITGLAAALIALLALMPVAWANPVAQAAEQTTDIAGAPSDAVLARINGEEIAKADIMYNYHELVNQYSGVYDPADESSTRALYQSALRMRVQTVMVRQYASELGLDRFTPDEESAIAENARSAYGAMVDRFKAAMQAEGEMTDEALTSAVKDSLAALGYTEATYEEAMRDAALLARMRDRAGESVSVSEEEVRAEYDRALAEARARYGEDPTQYISDVLLDNVIYCVPEGVRTVKHILIRSVDGATAYDAILEIHAYIAAGEDFDLLLTAYGQDDGMKQSSRFFASGYYVCEGAAQYDSAFVETAMALESAGDVSAPIETGYGWSIIKYLSDVPSGDVAYDLVRDQAEAALRSQKQVSAFNAFMQSYMETAQIEIVD